MAFNKAIAVHELNSHAVFTIYHYESCKVGFYYGRRYYERDLWICGNPNMGSARYWVKFAKQFCEVELFTDKPYNGCLAEMHTHGAVAHKVNC